MMAQDLKLFSPDLVGSLRVEMVAWTGEGCWMLEKERILTQAHTFTTFINILHKFLEAHFVLYRLFVSMPVVVKLWWKIMEKKMKTLADRKRDKFYSRRKRQLGNIK